MVLLYDSSLLIRTSERRFSNMSAEQSDPDDQIVMKKGGPKVVVKQDDWDGKPWNTLDKCECTLLAAQSRRYGHDKTCRERAEEVRMYRTPFEINLMSLTYVKVPHAERIWPQYFSFEVEQDHGKDKMGLWKRVGAGENAVKLFRYRMMAHSMVNKDFIEGRDRDVIIQGELASSKTLAWMSLWNVLSFLPDEYPGPVPVIPIQTPMFQEICTCCGSKRSDWSIPELEIEEGVRLRLSRQVGNASQWRDMKRSGGSDWKVR